MRLIFCVLLLFSLPLLAEEKKKGVFILRADEVHEGDLFAAASTVEISGTVKGDLYVLAAQVVMDGVVKGDFLGVAGSADIAGRVDRNVRLIAGHILVSGNIVRNLSCLSAHLQLLPTASLGGNLVVASMTTDIASVIQGNATLVAANARVSSLIKQDLQGYVGRLRLTSKAHVVGDLDYRSNRPATIDPGATIQGKVIYHPSLMHKLVEKDWIHRFLVGSKVLGIAMNVIYTLVIGWVLMRFFPANLHSALVVLSARPIRSFFCGLLFIVVMPLLLLILLISILGVPFALTLLAFNIVGFYSAKVYPLLWIAKWVQHKMHKKNIALFFIVATAIYFALMTIPVIGTALALIALLLGLGSGLLAQAKHGVLTKNQSK